MRADQETIETLPLLPAFGSFSQTWRAGKSGMLVLK